MSPGKPNYRLDAPDVVRRLFSIGLVMLLLGVSSKLLEPHYRFTRWLAWPLLQGAAMLLITSAVMIWGSKVGKLLDIRHIKEYAEALRALGMADVKVSAPNFSFFIPTHTLTARKQSPS